MLKQSSQPLELTYETFSLNSLLNALKCLNQCVLGPCPCVSVQLHCNEKSQKIDQKKKKKRKKGKGDGREGEGREELKEVKCTQINAVKRRKQGCDEHEPR